MKKTTGLACAVAAALGIFAAGGAAQALPLGLATGLPVAADHVSPVEQTQFIFGGRNYCWYLDGWHGPGWYWCGYAFRRGLGWGGPHGWHGWSHEGGRGPIIRGPGRGPVRGGGGGPGHGHHH